MENDMDIDKNIPPKEKQKRLPKALKEELEIAAAARKAGLDEEQAGRIVASHRFMVAALKSAPNGLTSHDEVPFSDFAEADDYAAAFERLAAADAAKEQTTFTGAALGVAVPATGTGAARIFNVQAGVRSRTGATGELKIYGYQDERGKGVTKPLERLAQHVHAIFRHAPILQPLKLDKRVISVNIEGADAGIVGYLSGEKSLTLAVVVAVVKAVCQKGGDDGYVFSGNIDFQGQLAPVGRIVEKTQAALDRGRIMVLPAQPLKGETPSDPSAHLRQAGVDLTSVRLFFRLDELFDALYGLDARTMPSAKGIASPKRAGRLLTGIHWFGAAAFVFFMIGLLLTGDLFYPSRMLIAFHLADASDRVFDWINLLYFLLLLVGAPVAIKHAIPVLTQTNAPLRRRKHWIVLASTAFWVLFAASSVTYINHLFEDITPIGRYEKIKPLIQPRSLPLFRWFLSDAETMLRQEFDRIRAAGSYGQAVDVGIELTRLRGLARAPGPDADLRQVRQRHLIFANDFTATVNLLLDRVHSQAQADRLLTAYKAYAERIHGHPGAGEAVFATVDAAGALVNKYFDGGPWPRFIDQLKRDYGVD